MENFQKKIEKNIYDGEKKSGGLFINFSKLKIDVDDTLKKLFSENFEEINSALEIFDIYANRSQEAEELPVEFFMRLKWCFEQKEINFKKLVISITSKIIQNMPQYIHHFAECDIFNTFILALPYTNVASVFEKLLSVAPEFLQSLGTEECIDFLTSKVSALIESYRNDIVGRVFLVLICFFKAEAVSEEKAAAFIPTVISFYNSELSDESIKLIAAYSFYPEYINILLQQDIFKLIIQNFTISKNSASVIMLEILSNISKSPFAASLFDMNIFYYLFAWCLGKENHPFFEVIFSYSCSISVNLFNTLGEDAVNNFCESRFCEKLEEFWNIAHHSESMEIYYSFVLSLYKNERLSLILNAIPVDSLFESILDSTNNEMIKDLIVFLAQISDSEVTESSPVFIQNVFNFIHDEYTVSQFEDLVTLDNKEISEAAQHILEKQNE